MCHTPVSKCQCLFDSIFKPQSLNKPYLRSPHADREVALCTHSHFFNSKTIYWVASIWQVLQRGLDQALFWIHWIFLEKCLPWKRHALYLFLFTFDFDLELWKWSCTSLAWCLAEKRCHLNLQSMRSGFLLLSFLFFPYNSFVGCEWDWYSNYLP